MTDRITFPINAIGKNNVNDADMEVFEIRFIRIMLCYIR